jgi:hypothetical protein
LFQRLTVPSLHYRDQRREQQGGEVFEWVFHGVVCSMTLPARWLDELLGPMPSVNMSRTLISIAD